MTFATTGCHDGPLYQLKRVNPFYVSQWNADREIGVTDADRRAALETLVDRVASMPVAEQETWTTHLDQILRSDPNMEMRRLAVRAAGQMQVPTRMALIKQGLDDDAAKVRMQSCYALSQLADSETNADSAARLLVATIGTEGDQDVKHCAIEALAEFDSPIATDSLRGALAANNPATQQIAMESLRKITGKDYGTDPATWAAAFEGKAVPERQTRIAEALGRIF